MSQISKSKERIILAGLVVFGLTLGLIISEEALRWYHNKSRGNSEFESLTDLRLAMLKPEDTSPGKSVSLHSIVTPHPDDKIIYDLRPNIDLTFQRARVRTNSCGMRGPEFSIEKPENTYRIALLGDSFTFGWGVEQEQTFASILENQLNRVSKGNPRFEVLNFGVPGYSTFQEVEKFLEVGTDFNPDAVLVYFVNNDFGLPFFVRDIGNPGGMLSGLEFARLSWKAVDPKIEEQRVQLLGLDPNRSLRKLSNYTRKNAIRLVVAINPLKSWTTERAKLWILEKRKDIIVPDLRVGLLNTIEYNKIDPKELTLSWDPHPSPVKHRILGELLSLYFFDQTSW